MNTGLPPFNMVSRQKDGEGFVAPSQSSVVEKQSAGRMLSLHNRLQQEAEKIRKWKIQTEVDIKLKERKLLEANQTLDTLRKSVLDLQLQNESLSIRLQEEIGQKEDLTQRVESTRDMCNLLKNFAANVGERINQCETEKQVLENQKHQHEQQLVELCEKFHGLEIVISERNQLAYQLEQERAQFNQQDMQQNESLKQTVAMLQQIKDDCCEKESIIQLTRSQLTENQHKLETLESEYARAINDMEKNLANAKIELDQLGIRLREVLERETAMSEKLEELETEQQIKKNELACHLELAKLTDKEKASLEQQLTLRMSELDRLHQNLQMEAEEKIALSQQIKEVERQTAELDEKKSHEILCLQKEIETLKKELCEKIEQIDVMKRQIENSERQRLNVADQLNETLLDKSMVESELKTAKTEASRLKKDLEKLTVKHQDLDQCSKEELKKAYSKVEQEQTEKLKMQDDLSRQLSEAQCEVEKLVQDLAQREQMFQDQLAANLKKQDCLADQLDKLKTDRTVLEAKIVGSREETSNAKQTIEILTEKLKDVEQTTAISVAALNDKLKIEQECHRQTEDKFKSLLATASKEADELKMEVKVLTQGKESAEKQIKSMGHQMAMSLESYKKGYDDILTRKEKEFDERIQLVDKQNDELKNQLESTRREKETTELKAVAESARVIALTENSKWELEAAISAKNGELEEIRRRLENLQKANEQKDRETAQMRVESQAALEQNELKCQIIASKEKELDELRKVVENMKTAIDKQKSAEVALLKTPVLPKEKRSELPKSKESDSLSLSKVLTVDREPSRHLLSADRSKGDVNSRKLQPVQDNMVTPQQSVQRSILKKSLTSTTRKRKEISFTSPPTDESSSDLVVMPVALKNLSQIKERVALQRRDGKIFLKPSPASRSSVGSSLPSKLAKARKQASSTDWFDNDAVFGFGAED